MVTKLRRVETLITTVAGRASPLACRVKRTTNPATGQAAKMTVVISGTPVKPRHFNKYSARESHDFSHGMDRLLLTSFRAFFYFIVLLIIDILLNDLLAHIP